MNERPSLLLTLMVGAILILGSVVFAEPRPQISVQPEEIRVVPVPDPVHPIPIRIDLWTDDNTYAIDDSVEISFRVDRDSYFYLFSTEATGVTRQIFPNRFDTENFLKAGVTYSIPKRGYDLVASGPPGIEKLCAVAIGERYDWLEREYSNGRFNADPFPVIQESPEAFYSRVEKSASASIHIETDEASIQIDARQDKRRPESIRVVPTPPRPAYGRAVTTIRVVGPRNYYPAPVPDCETCPPVEPVPHPDPHSFKTKVKINSDPDNAQIYIDGSYYGKAPLKVELPIGYHVVVVKKSGYHPVTRQILVERSNDTEKFRFKLERAGYSNFQGSGHSDSPHRLFRQVD